MKRLNSNAQQTRNGGGLGRRWTAGYTALTGASGAVQGAGVRLSYRDRLPDFILWFRRRSKGR